jgi:glutamate-1-semialdehyde aminotransferase
MCADAGEVARRIHEMTGVDRVAFFNTGSEAVMSAIRLARTVTARPKIVMFAGSYHGHTDNLLATGHGSETLPMIPGTPESMVQETCVLPYGEDESLAFIDAHAHELAAVLVEPVQSRRPEFQPAEFLRRLRDVTERHGIALIFDEVILGFRIRAAGAQAWCGVKADLVTYGKTIGGGMPIGIVAGKSQYMNAIDGGLWRYGDDSVPPDENTFIAGTFNHHPLAMAAALAVLEEIERQGPFPVQDERPVGALLLLPACARCLHLGRPELLPVDGAQR